MTEVNDIYLTPEEVRAINEATPEQWVEAAAELSQDPAFWQEMLGCFLEGFMRGLTK